MLSLMFASQTIQDRVHDHEAPCTTDTSRACKCVNSRELAYTWRKKTDASHVQCTSTGALRDCSSFSSGKSTAALSTSLTKPSNSLGSSGTSKSGQATHCSCMILRGFSSGCLECESKNVRLMFGASDEGPALPPTWKLKPETSFSAVSSPPSVETCSRWKGPYCPAVQ